VLFLALLLLFVVLLFEFRTFSAPAAILASALLSTFGGLLALLVTRTTFNVASFMGMIMVIGIVAKNGILLLDAEHHFRELGFSAEDAMIQAGRRRLRPIAMTALATVAGMLPLAFAIGAGSQMLQPLAITVSAASSAPWCSRSSSRPPSISISSPERPLKNSPSHLKFSSVSHLYESGSSNSSFHTLLIPLSYPSHKSDVY